MSVRPWASYAYVVVRSEPEEVSVTPKSPLGSSPLGKLPLVLQSWFCVVSCPLVKPVNVKIPSGATLNAVVPSFRM